MSETGALQTHLMSKFDAAAMTREEFYDDIGGDLKNTLEGVFCGIPDIASDLLGPKLEDFHLAAQVEHLVGFQSRLCKAVEKFFKRNGFHPRQWKVESEKVTGGATKGDKDLYFIANCYADSQLITLRGNIDGSELK